MCEETIDLELVIEWLFSQWQGRPVQYVFGLIRFDVYSGGVVLIHTQSLEFEILKNDLYLFDVYKFTSSRVFQHSLHISYSNCP